MFLIAFKWQVYTLICWVALILILRGEVGTKICWEIALIKIQEIPFILLNSVKI